MSTMQTSPSSKKWSTPQLLSAINLILALIGITVYLSGIVPNSHFLSARNHPTVFCSELGVLTLIIIRSAVAIWKK